MFFPSIEGSVYLWMKCEYIELICVFLFGEYIELICVFLFDELSNVAYC